MQLILCVGYVLLQARYQLHVLLRLLASFLHRGIWKVWHGVLSEEQLGSGAVLRLRGFILGGSLIRSLLELID